MRVTQKLAKNIEIHKNTKKQRKIRLYIYALIYIYIKTNLSTREVWDTRSIFRWSLTGFDSEFSFSKTGCHTKVHGPSLFYYLPIAAG